MHPGVPRLRSGDGLVFGGNRAVCLFSPATQYHKEYASIEKQLCSYMCKERSIPASALQV